MKTQSAPQTKKSATRITKLEKVEWDFTDCPKEELRWCDVYEHARQSAKHISEVESMRRDGHWSQTTLASFIDDRYARVGQKLFELFTEFPEAPFLMIDPKSRAVRCQELNELRRSLLVQIN